MRIVFLFSVLVLVSGCAHLRTAGYQCKLPTVELAVERPDGTRARTLSDAFVTGYVPFRAGPGERAASPAVLVLSGGGKWGAFGAGMLANWRDLPRFSRVTGVSTGALLGTFAFLGTDPPPEDRVLREEDDFPSLPDVRRNVDDAVAGYTISHERSLLKNNGGEFAVVRKGSFGDLAPLRKRLQQLISPQTILAVADQHDLQRRFYVGLVNADSGKAEAVDMTELALRGRNPAQMPLVRDCYIETLMAASSEPVGAQPVFIDDTLYLDAGIRFGVFLQEVEQSLETWRERRTRAGSDSGARPAIYMIVNGEMKVAPERRDKWSPLTLAKRSMGMVTDQIYRFSAKRVADYSRNTGADFYFAYAQGWSDHQWEGWTCSQWREADQKALKPLQFYPNMMKCLIDYGAWRQRNGPWDERPLP